MRDAGGLCGRDPSDGLGMYVCGVSGGVGRLRVYMCLCLIAFAKGVRERGELNDNWTQQVSRTSTGASCVSVLRLVVSASDELES